MNKTLVLTLAISGAGIAGLSILSRPWADSVRPNAPEAAPTAARSAAVASPALPAEGPGAATPGQATIARIHDAGRYAFALFHKAEDAPTGSMRKAVTAALSTLSDRAELLEVAVGDPQERPLVELYGLDRSPMPLLLALAPNGAVTAGFTQTPTDEDIAGAFVSPALAGCMKGSQDQKIVLVTVQPAGSLPTPPAGVVAFQADERFRPVTEVVTFAANDEAEREFLKTLEVEPTTAVTVTMLLVPPGQMIAKFEGQVPKDVLVSEVTDPKHGSACAGGVCGPSGCRPTP